MVKKRQVKEVEILPLAMPPPTNVVATPSNKSIYLNWDLVPEATSYRVYLDNVFKDMVRCTSYNFDGLNPSTEYRVSVHATDGTSTNNSQDVVVYSTTTSSTGNEPIPEVPAIMSADPAEKSIYMIWDASRYSDNYEVYQDGVYKYTGNSAYTFYNLKPNTTYTLGVLGVNETGKSAIDTIVVTTDMPSNAPNTPTGLHVMSKTSTSVDIMWSVTEGADYYKTYLNGTFISDEYDDGDGFAPDYNFTGLTPATSYIFGITAVNSAGESPMATIQATTNDPRPQPPTNLVAEPTSDSIYFSWDVSQYADRYELYLNEDWRITTTETEYIFANLQPSTMYMVGVNAENESGESSIVSTTVTTKAPPIEFMNMTIRNFTLEDVFGNVYEVSNPNTYPQFLNPKGLGYTDDGEMEKPSFDIYCLDTPTMTANDQYDSLLAFIANTPTLYLNYYNPTKLNAEGYTKVKAEVKMTKIDKTEKKDFGLLICPIEFEKQEDWVGEVVNERFFTDVDNGDDWKATLEVTNKSFILTPNTITIEYPAYKPIISCYSNGFWNASIGINHILAPGETIKIVNGGDEPEISLLDVDGEVIRNLWNDLDRTRDCQILLEPGLNSFTLWSEASMGAQFGSTKLTWEDSYATI